MDDVPGRVHDVSRLTGEELAEARRGLLLSLAMAEPGSPVRVPICAQMTAIDDELIFRGCQEIPAGDPDTDFKWLG